jgi:hypothetical protein
MNKKLCIVISILSTALLAPNVFAYISGKAIVSDHIVYCPSEVSCSEAGSTNLSSCSFVSDNPELWGFSYAGSSPTTSQGRYILQGNVLAPHHYSGIVEKNSKNAAGYVVCTYSNSNGQSIVVRSKAQANLEAFADKSTNWYDTPQTQSMWCPASGNIQQCPLKEASSILIQNRNLATVLASINGLKISQEIMLGDYFRLSYDDVLAGCSSKNCKIDIVSSKDAIYGSVEVDMDNKLKILQIDQVRSSEVMISQVDSFNSIEIQYPSLK